MTPLPAHPDVPTAPPTSAPAQTSARGGAAGRLKALYDARGVAGLWAWVWMRWSGPAGLGRLITRIASWGTPPFRGRCGLATLHRKGYTAPSAIAHQPLLQRGAYTFIGERTTFHFGHGARAVRLEDRVHLIGDTYVEVGDSGSVTIGEDTHLQPHCHLCSFVEPITIGRGVQMASYCRLYSYDHGVLPDRLISEQPLTARGPIVIEDDAWLGTGVVVLSGVRIGRGAVVGAGSVVTRDVPDGAIAVGVPARVVKHRAGLA